RQRKRETPGPISEFQGGEAMRLLVTPARALNDQALDVRVVGAPAGAAVTVRSQLVDDFGRPWEAQASYQADASGTVEVAATAPVDASYTGTDPMGLIWSMTPVDQPRVNGAIKNGLQPTILTLSAETDGEHAEAQVERLFIADGVRRVPVREAGLAGTLFLPPGAGPFPGILVFSGSGGGIEEGRA